MSTPDAAPYPRNSPLEWRPITRSDVDEWHALVRRMAVEDKPDWVESRVDLEQALESTKNDPAVDTLLGLDHDGVVRAFGRISVNPGSGRAHSAGGVDPRWRRRGIGNAVYGWQVERVRRRFESAGVTDGVLRTYVEEPNESHQALMVSAGNMIVRWFTEMTRPLDSDIPEFELPEGLRMATFDADISEAVRLAHNEAFQDHWGSEPRDEESWRFTVTHPEFREDWSVAVIDSATGEVAAYELASFDPDSRELLGHTEGYIDLLGVRRRWRGLKLAPALLAEAMRRFRADGIEHAGLGVDTENPSGALGLYERMGYTPTQRSMAFERPVSS